MKKERTNNLIKPYKDEQHLPKWCGFEQSHGSKALLLAALEQSRRKEPGAVPGTCQIATVALMFVLGEHDVKSNHRYVTPS